MTEEPLLLDGFFDEESEAALGNSGVAADPGIDITASWSSSEDPARFISGTKPEWMELIQG